MKKKQVLSTVLATAMIASLGVTASAATDVAANELAYKGELEIMHFSTSEESEGNGGSDGFRTVLAAWDEAHPDITLNQNVLANAEYNAGGSDKVVDIIESMDDAELKKWLTDIVRKDMGLGVKIIINKEE